jgi:hypothetical protein
MFYRFRYEAEFYPTLSRVPLHVRMKLDLMGGKISLRDWLAFSLEERAVLCHLPIESAEEKQVFGAYLNFLSQKYRGQPVATAETMNSRLWSAAEVPPPVHNKSAACSKAVTLSEWTGWPDHERYALYKTAISQSQPEAFEQVLKQLRDSKSSE